MKEKYKFCLAAVFACLSAGCTEVDLCEEASHPHVASLKVNYEWGDYASEKPEQMYLVAARILNTYHCCFTTRAEDGAFLMPAGDSEKPDVPDVPEVPDTPDTPDGSGSSDGTGNAALPDASGKTDAAEEPETPATPEEPENLVPQDETPVLGGEYFMMAFTKDDERLKVLNLQEYLDDPSVSVKEIRLCNELLKEEDYPSLEPDAEDKEKVWMDFNPGYKFVSSPGRVFVSRVNYAKFTVGKTYTQTFVPSALTQRIFFTFTMDFDNSGIGNESLIVEPSQLYLEIAGVIPEVGLADGLLYTNSLRRMFLTTEEDGVKTETDGNGRVKTIAYKGYIDAFGLMPGPDVHAISGPGILRLAMKVTLSDGGERTIRTSCNISSEIAEANLTKATGYSNIREKVVDEGTVRVSHNIQINAKKVIAGNSDGVKGWDEAFVDVDI